MLTQEKSECTPPRVFEFKLYRNLRLACHCDSARSFLSIEIAFSTDQQLSSKNKMSRLNDRARYVIDSVDWAVINKPMKQQFCAL